MSNLRTDYKDDVFTGSRKYHTVNNPDGTVSFTDETEYEQNGDTYGAAQINEVNDIINNLDASAYRSTDSVENALADNDYFPFYDTSASASKKTAWSNIKSLLTQLLAIKVHNSNSAGTYGAGNASYFGHVKLSDNYASSAGNASQSVGASSQAAYNAYNTANTNSANRYNDVVSELTANGNRIYMDYKNGKYGYNTSANRGADTFFPFKSEIATQDFTYSITVSKEDSGTWYEVTGSQTIDVGLNDKEIVGYGIISDRKTFDNSSPERSYVNSLTLTGTQLAVTITVGIGNDRAASATHTLIVRVFYQ